MAILWTHHEVEYPLPIVNGIHVGHVPRWITVGIQSFAKYGHVSYGTVYRVVKPTGYKLDLVDPYQAAGQCSVFMVVRERDSDGVPVLVVHDVDVG